MENNFKKIFMLFVAVFAITALFAFSQESQSTDVDITRPYILSVSPANNERDVPRNENITILFSEDMDFSTLNFDNIEIVQRTTPESGEFRSVKLNYILTYADNTVKLIPINHSYMFSPDQEYGNVFTVIIKNETRDLANNTLSRDYVWSFTTGKDLFYTGNTTEQIDQTPIPVNIPQPPSPEPQAPIVSTAPMEAAAANGLWGIAANDLWFWIIAGLLLLLLIAAIISLLIPSPRRTKAYSPFGDVHPVSEIEGIGPKYARRLSAMGIKDTKQLWEANAITLSRKTKAPISVVKSWQNMAELASVKGINPQDAELLERSGIHSISQLRESDPDEVLGLVQRKQDALKINIHGAPPAQSTVEHWIEDARSHKFTETIEDARTV